MIPPTYYRGLLSQTKRLEAFKSAIQKVVTTDDTVLDLGTGLGTYAMFAADLNPKMVWAIDPDPIIRVARNVAVANGYDGRIDFIEGKAPGVRLPEKASVLIYEDFSQRLLDEPRFRLLQSVHAEYLAKGAKVIPCRAKFKMALVSYRPVRELLFGFGSEGDETHLGIDWSQTRYALGGTPLPVNLPPEALATEPAEAGEISLASPPKIDSLDLSAEWEASGRIEADGVLLWFDMELADGVWMSNAPGAEQASWGSVYLPLDPILRLEPGVRVSAEVKPSRVSGDAPGWLTWTVKAGDEERWGSEFESGQTPDDAVLLASPDVVPILDGAGEAEALVLSLVDGKRTIGEVIFELRDRLGDLSEAEAGRIVVRVLQGKVGVKLPTPKL
ncbi:MAG: 50S ribosomal protein L11 methyltransferase [Gemmatimonadota bacterium]|nr:50S ribosomal protein L11 methyltransferase [Gemmatimonadota bacterium]